MTERISVMVRSMTWESDGVLSVTFVDPDGGALPSWEPGAHIDLVIPAVGERQYSLCGDPGDDSRWRIGVLREPKSRGGSAYVHTALRPGQVISVTLPGNNFRLVEAQRYVFIAGGVGITPILPMIAAAEDAGREWTLTYGGRRKASMAFTEELASHGDKVTLWPEDQHGHMDLDTLLVPQSDTAVYCCGPEGLLAGVEQRCAAWPSDSLHVERFSAKALTEEQRNYTGAFGVVLSASGRTITVPPELSILGALEAEGIFPASSCMEGTCGTCETKVLEGIPDHRDSLLTDDERAANDTMFICVSREKSEKLVLDL
jgi:ferredoxin-NADP reductase